jgi:eukaryotic-like serine/threonine-protein kinase
MEDTLPYRVGLGAFEVDLRTGELRQGDGPVLLLPHQPLQILRMLVEAGGEIVSRDKIQQKLWPNDTVVEFDHSINAAIKKLRRAFGDSAEEPQYIGTIAKRGYRLLVAVTRLSGSDDPSGSIPILSPNAGEKMGHPHSTPLRSARDENAESRWEFSSYLIGKKVSHYRVLSVIGGGGMGLVYEAEDLKLGRRVALKFLPEELASDAVALQRFEREAKTASSLNHPNICTIYEVEEHEGRSCIVMELLTGKTLRDWLASARAEDKTLPPAQVLDVAMQVASGLQAAHEKGIVHRDIKPANIFLTASGQVKILDFGVAKLMELGELERTAAPEGESELTGPGFGSADQPSTGLTCGLQPTTPPDAPLTRTGLAMGTVGYMSPEQVRGEKLDARTDIFSFGLVLYEMATGQRAFGGETAAVVHDAILTQTPASARELNPATPRKSEEIINRAIEKDRELRYQSATDMRADLETVAADRTQQPSSGKSRVRFRWKGLAAAAAVGCAMFAGGLYWRSHRPVKLTDKDAIVLADFDNKTGDAVFDDTLRQGLSIQLQQSPFLTLVSERKVNATLTQMGRHAGDRLTPETTREVCQRTGSKAMLSGSIAGLASQYVIQLKAVDCNLGDTLAEVQERAADKAAVLNTLDKAAIALRAQLGESLGSVQKYATPLVEATTPSLEALKAYSQGQKTFFATGPTPALPFYKRAVELDPNFAMAYATMSAAYYNLNEAGRAGENALKAYNLREKVSERERLSIEVLYYMNVTGELEKAAQAYEMWEQNDPQNASVHGNLSFISLALGNLEMFLQESREAMRLQPNADIAYANLGAAYQSLNLLDEAEAVYSQAERRKLGSELLLANGYNLAFVKGDTAQMAQLAATAIGRPGTEDVLLAAQADTEAWRGKLKNARALTSRAIDSAQHNDAKETAAVYHVSAALIEAESGNRRQARTEAGAALKLSSGRDLRAIAALALARAGDAAGAGKLAIELDKTSPLDTLIQRYWLPTIWAAIALEGKDPNRAVEQLKVASSIELGQPSVANIRLSPAYVRGEAYLMLHNGKAAALEFQKLIDHYGLVGNSPWGALARLGVARACALEAAADPAARDKARTAYQNFLTLWKDADPDIPIYKQAKLEYAKLQ